MLPDLKGYDFVDLSDDEEKVNVSDTFNPEYRQEQEERNHESIALGELGRKIRAATPMKK